MKSTILTLLVFSSILIGYDYAAYSQEKSIDVKKIWDAGQHNAFPDLLAANGYFYVTVREGSGHVNNSNDGQVRIIRSKDFEKWQTVALFKHDIGDVREARLSLLPDGRIVANLAVGLWKDEYKWLSPYVSISDKEGKVFSPIEKVNLDPALGSDLDWIWRVTWNKGVGYGILYRRFADDKEKEWEVMLLKTTDGKSYDFVSKIPVEGMPNESTIRFDQQGKMYAMVRREFGDKAGAFVTSHYPYQQWNSTPLSWQLGGPNFLFLNKKKLVMGSRYKQSTQARTGIFVTDLTGVVLKTIELPSAGDNSYPGMVTHKGNLVVVYYSSHEGKSAIYLAKIPVKEL